MSDPTEIERKLWVCGNARPSSRLHAVRERSAFTIETMCGRVLPIAFAARPWDQKRERCAGCCRQTQMPRGTGSPIKDRDCRIAAGWVEP